MRWWEAWDSTEGGDQEIILQGHLRTGPHFPLEMGCISTVWTSPLFHPKHKCPAKAALLTTALWAGSLLGVRRAGYCVNETAHRREPPPLGICRPLEGSLDF